MPHGEEMPHGRPGATVPPTGIRGVPALLERLLPAGSLRRRVAGGAFWSIAGSGVAQAASLAWSVLAARVLGASEFGELGMVLSTVNLFAMLATAGLGVTATKHVAEHRTSDPPRAGRVIGFAVSAAALTGVVVGLAVVAASGALARGLGAPHLAPYLQVSAVIMALSAVNGAQVGALAGLEAFRGVAIGNLVRGLATLVLVVAGVLLWGVMGALIGNALAGVATLVAHGILVRAECRKRGFSPSFRWERGEAIALSRYALPALVAGVSFTPASWWSNAVLVSGSSYLENGVFNAARQWQAVVLFFSTAVANLGLPLLSSAAAERDGRTYRRRMALNFWMTAASALAVALPVAVASPWIMAMYGAEFAGRGGALAWMTLASVLTAINITVGHAIWSLNAARSGMLLALLRGAALVGFSYQLVHRGADGIALAWVLMGAVQTTVQVPFTAWLLLRQERMWRERHAG